MMSVHKLERTRSQPENVQEKDWDDEIDLSTYLDVLINWWREIVLVSVLTVVAAVGGFWTLNQLETPLYRSSSDVMMARVVSIATLDERFQTLVEENPTAASNAGRRAALIGLANSSVIAQAVVAELGDVLSEQDQNPARLLEKIEAAAQPSTDVRTQSDLIRISAIDADPERAALIANTWAHHYVKQMNELFGQVPAQVIESAEAELLQADDAYQEAQRALELFIGAQRTNELNRQIAEKAAQLNALQNGRVTALTAIIDRELSARLNTFVNLVDAQTSGANAVLIEQIEARLTTLSQLHGARSRAAVLADQARSLATQIELGGRAAIATNALALQLLKAQAFAAEVNTRQVLPGAEKIGTVSQARQSLFSLPADLQLVLPDGAAQNAETQDAQAQAADAAALASALDAYAAKLDEQIAALSTELLAGEGLNYLAELNAMQNTAPSNASGVDAASNAEPDNELAAAIQESYAQLFDLNALGVTADAVDPVASGDPVTTAAQQLGQEIQSLQAQVEAENARTLQLTQQRDLAWSTYDTLSNKVAELMLERQAANSEVRLASPAIPPLQPLPGPSLRLILPAAAALGLITGVLMAFIAAYLGKEPFLRRRRPAAT